jgi:outer membrane protein assembly factor BamB
LYADGRLYFLNEEGVTTVVRAASDFEVLATNALGERTLASPAAADGALYLRTEEHLFKITGAAK